MHTVFESSDRRNPRGGRARDASRLRRAVLLLGVALVLALLAGAAASAAERAPPASEDGLERIQVRGVDRVYRRPGVDWAAYRSVLIAPVSVSFSRTWDPRDYGSFGLSPADVNEIRGRLATLAHEVFARVLAEGGYAVVDAPAAGVLEVRPDIVDLYVNAPDVNEAGRVQSYVTSAGEMKLVLELRDAVTGTVLARAIDRKRGRDLQRLEWANRVFNRAEAERALREWAVQLRENLAAARGR